VQHAGGDVEGDLDVGGGRSFHEADRVIEEDLASSGFGSPDAAHCGAVTTSGA
jgi:hypothetical protein